ncbi:hypothetical protein VI08_03280 [Luteibacter yeojuensis]|uniref:Uncharacterized protein n=2 Tax=Luteibacter yeojuensis TaxID=345309 RepID=A0A0F3L062_9GAMM|nr:hypothetical protein VI08_03280 [Luteibacter yeojuensis]
MFPLVAGALALCAFTAPTLAADLATQGWDQGRGVYLLPDQHGAQFGLVAYEDRPTHRVSYGFRELPQRANCAAGSIGRSAVFDIEGQRLAFRRECINGTFTFVPRSTPTRRAFEGLLASHTVLHMRAPSFFPYTFDLAGLPAVHQALNVQIARRAAR